ncbi:E3 ubiquitin-protein ligase RFI2-like [Silene latifolia]|uniref:E3 ubiquitin-protein ligase RFI2-like n=1 Tax=Silene latifolia TaxID=37657 RepID=UPI003D77C7AB
MGFDDGGGKKSLSSSTVSCSICLEYVTDIGERSWAKLQCGHEFHLDCIGSAFNIKGAMQCPNCRKIEKGQWLYATSCRSFTDFVEDWAHGEDLYDLNYSDIFGIQWCPIPAFSRPPSFDEGDIPSTAYQDLLGQHAVFAEHSAVSSSAHQCPYVAYYGPLHSSSSNSVVSADGLNFSNQWGCPPGPSELQSSYTFPAVETQYHGWEHHSMPFSATSSRLGGSDLPSAPSVHQRSSRANADLSRSGSFVHASAMNHSSGSRVGSSATSSMVPPYPGSAARARDRVQALQAYSQPPNTSLPMRTPMLHGSRRSNHQGLSQVGPLPPLSDQTGGLYIFPSGTSSRSFSELENPSRFHGWERAQFPSSLSTQLESDSNWVPGPGHNSFHHRYGSEQTPSQSRS